MEVKGNRDRCRRLQSIHGSIKCDSAAFLIDEKKQMVLSRTNSLYTLENPLSSFVPKGGKGIHDGLIKRKQNEPCKEETMAQTEC
jgi:hypothetical protein